MNLPNKLTIFRACMIPFFVFFMEVDVLGGASKYIAATIFIIASITDAMDGHIARKYNLVTNFGKFMDPLADKFMVIAALLGATAKYDYLRPVLVWITLIVVFRELAVTSLRLLANNSSGIVIAAAWAGKVKTVAQCVSIVAILLEPLIPLSPFCEWHIITWCSLAVMTFFTVYSGIQYFVAYKDYLTME